MIFDSDVLIWFLRREPHAMELIDTTPDLAVPIVAVIEVLQGAKSKVEMRLIRNWFVSSGFRILPLNESIGAAAMELIEEHALSSGLQLADALIAATAIEAGEALVTGNTKHFRAVRKLELKAFRPRRGARSLKLAH
ncbi:MAG TPA: type II toxin-antitoxin system VapC family toxin [Bryobacteraceae bacterium]